MAHQHLRTRLPAAAAQRPRSNRLLPLLAMLLVLMACGHSATPNPTPPSHTICLNFPANNNSRTTSSLSALASCARIVPILQSIGITWTQSYCMFTPPLYLSTSPRLGSPELQVYTCMNTSAINAFSGALTALWGAAFPFVSTQLRAQLVAAFSKLPTIGLLVATPTARLPVGLASQRGKWMAMVADNSVIASPPPPMGSGSHFYPPPAPPVPPRQECKLFGGGDALRVEGLVLCVQPKYEDPQVNNQTCVLKLTFKITNVGSNIIPERGIGTNFVLSLGTAELKNWSLGMFNVFQAGSSVAIKGVGKGIGPPAPGQQQIVPLTFTVACSGSTVPAKGLPQSCGCVQDVMIQPPAGGGGTEAPCTGLTSSVDGSDQCFTLPQAIDVPPPDLNSLTGGPALRGARMAAASAPTCTFSVQFTVKNLGASAVTSIPGPLVVDLGAAGGRLVLSVVDNAKSRVTCHGVPGSQNFRISQFGSLMQPQQSSTFTLSFTYSGPCSEVKEFWADVMKLIVFLSGQHDPVTSVQSSSETAGNHVTSPDESALAFNDKVNVDVRNTCIFPQAILMDYKRGGGLTRPTSYLYVKYPAQVDGIPVIHGQVPSGFYDSSSGFSSADLFNTPKGRNSTGDIGDWRIIKIVAYVMNITDASGASSENFVCGMDLWVVSRSQVYTGGQIYSPQYKLGCSPRNDYSLVNMVQPIQFAAPPPNAFFGWFAGAESSDHIRITNLQAVWVACTGDDPTPPSPTDAADAPGTSPWP